MRAVAANTTIRGTTIMCLLCRDAATGLRRRAMIGGLAAMGGFTVARGATLPADAPNAIAPDAALAQIMAGNARYATNMATNKDYGAGRLERAKAQFPIAAIVGCADSRVVPELAFDQGPGRLFVVRVAGNSVNGDGLASLEYGTKFLGTPLILVLGHSGCGAISAAIKMVREGAQLPGHLPNLMQDLTPAVRAAMARKPKDLLAEATRENVRRNVARLQADQPIIAGQVAAGTVKVVGGVYDISTGRVVLI